MDPSLPSPTVRPLYTVKYTHSVWGIFTTRPRGAFAVQCILCRIAVLGIASAQRNEQSKNEKLHHTRPSDQIEYAPVRQKGSVRWSHRQNTAVRTLTARPATTETPRCPSGARTN